MVMRLSQTDRPNRKHRLQFEPFFLAACGLASSLARQTRRGFARFPQAPQKEIVICSLAAAQPLAQ
jgi:hypothetical protein